MVGMWVKPDGADGRIEASITRNPSVPYTGPDPSTTAPSSGDRPIAAGAQNVRQRICHLTHGTQQGGAIAGPGGQRTGAQAPDLLARADLERSTQPLRETLDVRLMAECPKLHARRVRGIGRAELDATARLRLQEQDIDGVCGGVAVWIGRPHHQVRCGGGRPALTVEGRHVAKMRRFTALAAVAAVDVDRDVGDQVLTDSIEPDHHVHTYRSQVRGGSHARSHEDARAPVRAGAKHDATASNHGAIREAHADGSAAFEDDGGNKGVMSHGEVWTRAVGRQVRLRCRNPNARSRAHRHAAGTYRAWSVVIVDRL